MTDTNTPQQVQLSADDATPTETYVKIFNLNEEEGKYPKNDCLPCGTTIRMGFFFDAFGRNRDKDDRSTPQYSNICRLWEAHRDNRDNRKLSNQFWFRFYYSGLGTPLNDDADVETWRAGEEKILYDIKTRVQKLNPTQTMTNAAKALGAAAGDIAGMNPTLKNLKKPEDTVEFLRAKPIDQVYTDVKDNLSRSADIVTSPQRVEARTKGYGVLLGRKIKETMEIKTLLKEGAEIGLKGGALAVKSIFTDVAFEAIPILRDNPLAAEYLGTGIDSRLASAEDQFEAAYDLVKKEIASTSKIIRVEVSVFGADRGAVLARVFINGLVDKYRNKKSGKLEIEGVEIKIKFLGLLDAISSVMSETDAALINWGLPALAAAFKVPGLAAFLPTVKANEKDRALSVPSHVDCCVHFAAAHELRSYQCLDSLEKTRGTQFLYPGTSCDVVGGAPLGSLGANAELMRVPLQDMLLAALEAGVRLDTMEDLSLHKPKTFKLFTLAEPITYEGKQYKIKDLMRVYQERVKREPGLNFADHSKAFVQWLAVRYQSADFRNSVTNPRVQWEKQRYDSTKQIQTDEMNLRKGYKELGQIADPIDQDVLGQMKDAYHASEKEYIEILAAESIDYKGVWKRLQEEAEDLMKNPTTDDVKKSLDYAEHHALPGGTRGDVKKGLQTKLSLDVTAIAQGWKDGLSGNNPLAPEIMVLFDTLVHDAILTSWPDQLLAGPLYFKTREKDVFGVTDYAKEADEEKDRLENERKEREAENTAESNRQNWRGIITNMDMGGG